MRSVLAPLFAAAISLATSGCGVYMAFTQPPPVDVGSLEEPGLPRDFYVQKLGFPKGSSVNADGSKVDVYEFYEGSSAGWSMGRGAFHVAADLFTLALWEVVATPMEWGIRGDKLTARAEFDKNERMTSFRILGRETKPLEKIHREQNGNKVDQ